MDRIEKLSRKIDIKDASGMNTDREFAELLETIIDTAPNKDKTIAELDAESVKEYVKAFSVIPASDPEIASLECCDRIEKLNGMIRATVSKKSFSIEKFQELIDYEDKLTTAWGLLFTGLSKLTDTDDMSYIKQEFKDVSDDMLYALYDKATNAEKASGFTLNDWKNYFMIETDSVEYTIRYLREAIRNKSDKDIFSISNVIGILYVVRSKLLAAKYLPMAKGELI